MLQLHRKLKKLDEVLAEDPNEIANRERFEAQAEHSMEQDALLTELRKITIPRRG